MNVIGAKVEVEGYILRVNTAMNALQCNLDLLIDSVINAQKEALPQVISPVTLMEVLIKSIPAFPKHTVLPFPLSMNSVHLTQTV